MEKIQILNGASAPFFCYCERMVNRVVERRLFKKKRKEAKEKKFFSSVSVVGDF
ncbi:MAG: hypothetical protein J6C85_01130 [Alphaproteobacteria bacterium]|nr:hypothetical protein [Alphaproteobacteria bacterium]